MKQLILTFAVCFVPFAPPAFAQAPRAGTLQVTVVDQSGAVLPDATVMVTGAEPATSAAAYAPAQASNVGIATVSGLVPGRYNIEATFPAFETRLLKDVRIRSGDNRQVMVLAIQKLESSVTVGQGNQEAASDRAGRFGTTLTREQIDALSDDPDTLRQQLQDMAGPGVVIRIDSFEGGALPAKAQIRSIRISRDQFAAENHTAGGVFVEIITQPGVGPVRYGVNFRFRDGALSGRSPFTSALGPEQNMNLGLNIGGTLVKEKSSFGLNVFGLNSYDTPSVNLALATGGIRSETLPVRTPRKNIFVNGQLDYALTLNQTLRFNYNMSRNTSSNLGIGGFDEVERAYSTENNLHILRVAHFGPLGRRAFTRSRGQAAWSDSDTHSTTEAVTVRVNDAFTSGGAQRAGGQHSRTFSLATDLDYVRGIHSLRGGIALDGGWYRSDDTTNYLGTYTFESLDTYPDHPKSYTRRMGPPNIQYQNLQAGVYLQDDIRVSKNLTLSPGVRYEVQTHVRDNNNVGPRFGVTWAPFASGITTLRGSAGIFYDWLATGTYEQTLRVDGFRQQELNIVNPPFLDPTNPPVLDPGDVGSVPPINRYFLENGLSAPKTTRFSAGIDQGLGKLIRLAGTYSYQRGSGLPRGLNRNAPEEDGARPDPRFGNVIEVVSDASSRQHQLQVDSNINPGALLPAFGAPLISWKRATVFINYTLAKVENNTDGAFSTPATGDLNADWGPAANDVRQRLNLTFNNQVIRNLLVSLNLSASTGTAYTVRTGNDDNADLIFNDRPAGVGRNTLRTSAQWGLNVNVAYLFAFGRLSAPLPPGIGVFGGGGAAQVRTFDPGNLRYRLQLFVQATNVTNHANYTGYSGTMTSQFYLKPTSVIGTRKIDAGINFSF